MTAHSSIQKEIRQRLKRSVHSHKGDYGKVLVLAGSRGMTGAASLCCLGALRSGAGLVTLGIPESLNGIMECKLTEAMTYPLPETDQGSLSSKAFDCIAPMLERFDVVALGPGLSQHSETKKFVEKFVLNASIPMVLDADALNVLSDCTEMLAKNRSSVIMTPHIKEFSRFFKINVHHIEQNRKAITAKEAFNFDITIVLKGHETVVADKAQSYCNITGNPGLATGGSGDVLTGIIAAFVGQGIEPFCAAKYGVYIHGLAADLAAHEKTVVSLIPSDIIKHLPCAFKKCGL